MFLLHQAVYNKNIRRYDDEKNTFVCNITILIFQLISCKPSGKIEVVIGMWPESAIYGRYHDV
jgi:hypothetical protein